MERLKPGKLDPDFLAALFARNRVRDPRVLIGPGVGLDVAVIDQGRTCLVVKTDPITFTTESLGWYAVTVNANDIAVSGARPVWFLAALLLPADAATREMAEAIYNDLQDACEELEIDLIGGHTEVTPGIDRPIMTGIMLGEVERDKLIRSDGARPGDRLLLTRGAAIEGTALIALEQRDRLVEATGEEFADACARFLREPGISVLRDAMTACDAGRVHALHDPTEGGILTGIWEMAQAAGCGARVEKSRIPVYPETARACEVFGLDPLGLIASGALLIAAEADDAARIMAAFEEQDVPCAEIGAVTESGAPCLLVTESGETELPTFPQDEITRLPEG